MEFYSTLSNNMSYWENRTKCHPIIKANAWLLIKKLSKNKTLSDCISVLQSSDKGIMFELSLQGVFFEIQYDKIIINKYIDMGNNISRIHNIFEYNINDMDECVKFIEDQFKFA